MQHFMVLYAVPAAVVAEWMQKPEAERKESEEKMKSAWDEWMARHKKAVQNTIALGKTKRVTSAGVADARNDLMLSSYVEAESLEAAADLFKDHPHLGIPSATIEVMPIRQM